MATLALESPEQCPVPEYARLFAPERWAELGALFAAEARRCYGLGGGVGTLEVVLQAGLAALKTPICMRCGGGKEGEAAEGGGRRSGRKRGRRGQGAEGGDAMEEEGEGEEEQQQDEERSGTATSGGGASAAAAAAAGVTNCPVCHPVRGSMVDRSIDVSMHALRISASPLTASTTHAPTPLRPGAPWRRGCPLRTSTTRTLPARSRASAWTTPTRPWRCPTAGSTRGGQSTSCSQSRARRGSPASAARARARPFRSRSSAPSSSYDGCQEGRKKEQRSSRGLCLLAGSLACFCWFCRYVYIYIYIYIHLHRHTKTRTHSTPPQRLPIYACVDG